MGHRPELTAPGALNSGNVVSGFQLKGYVDIL